MERTTLGRLGVGALIFAALLGVTRRAEAIAAPNLCIPARMAPVATSIPHNFPGFGYDVPSAATTNVHLVDTTKGASELPVTLGPVTAPWNKVSPQAGFTVGDSYTLTFDSLCYGGMTLPEQKPITFTIVADAPIPTTIGDVMGTPTVVVKDHGTSEVDLDAIYTLSAEMKPWAAVYELALEMDGRTMETHANVASAGDTVHLTSRGWCDEVSSKATTHTVRLTATLPFSPGLQTMTTALDFTCPAPHIVTPTAGVLTPPTPTETTTTPTSGAGTHSGGCAISASSASSAASDGILGGVGLLLGVTVILRKRTTKGAR